MPTLIEAKSALVSLIGYYLDTRKTINAACYTIAKKLENQWTGKYIYHVYTGKSNPSIKLKRAIIRLHRKISNTYPRHRLYIQAESAEEKARWMEMTMKERREGLNEKYNKTRKS